MRLKIISDGSWRGTRVVNADTGALVEGVVRISWKSGSWRDVPSVEIEVVRVPVEIVADVATWHPVEM